MTKADYYSWLKRILVVGTIFMIGEAMYHFSGVRIWGTTGVWPEAAIVYSQFFMWLWASASLVLALVLWFCYRYFDRVQPLLIGLGLFSLFHAGILFYFSRLPLTQIWAATPATFVWFELYPLQLKVEAGILLAFSFFIAYGLKHQYLSTK